MCVQLLDTKSTDRSQTLLHYIANVVREKYPAVSPFYNELHYVDKAAAGEESTNQRAASQPPNPDQPLLLLLLLIHPTPLPPPPSCSSSFSFTSSILLLVLFLLLLFLLFLFLLFLPIPLLQILLPYLPFCSSSSFLLLLLHPPLLPPLLPPPPFFSSSSSLPSCPPAPLPSCLPLFSAPPVSLENVLSDVKEIQRGMELTWREFSVQHNATLKDFISRNESRLGKMQEDARIAQVPLNALSPPPVVHR